MATREVLFSTCDRCHTEVETAMEKPSSRRVEFILPLGWIHVSGNTRNSSVFALDLCGECSQIVTEAAGMAGVVK